MPQRFCYLLLLGYVLFGSPSFIMSQVKSFSYAEKPPTALIPLITALNRHHTSASIEFSGKCSTLNSPEFPEIPNFDKATVNKIIGKNHKPQLIDGIGVVRVKHISPSIISIKINYPPADILDVKIKHLSFVGVSTPSLAVSRIFNSAEVTEFMRGHGIQWPYSSSIATGILPIPP